MKARIIILEDDVLRKELFSSAFPNCFITDSVDDFVVEAMRGFNIAYMDRDIGQDPITGETAVKMMAKCSCKNSTIIIHSMNTPATLRMKKDLLDQGWSQVSLVPYINLIDYLIDCTKH